VIRNWEGTAAAVAKPSAPVVKLGVPMTAAPWIVSDALWERIEPLLPKVERRFRFPGRNRRPDRGALQGILFVLHTGIAWRHLPRELGFGSGSTCYRRLDEWQQAGVWERLHALLLAELRAAGELEWSRAVADSSHVQAKKGAPRRARARSIAAAAAPSTTSWSTRAGSRSPGRSPAATATTSPS
jgi:transposase